MRKMEWIIDSQKMAFRWQCSYQTLISEDYYFTNQGFTQSMDPLNNMIYEVIRNEDLYREK